MSIVAQEPLIQTSTADMLCPTCNYDLRGVTGPVCPECGTRFTLEGVAAHARFRWRLERVFVQLLVIPCVWFICYFLLGKIFHGTVDRVDANWVKLVFLNMPLQMLLSFLAFGLLKVNNVKLKRCGGLLTIIVLALITSHFVISLFTV